MIKKDQRNANNNVKRPKKKLGKINSGLKYSEVKHT